MKKLWNLVKREEGTEIAEWGILFALVLLASIVIMALVGPQLSAVWQRITDELAKV